jgi:hypothetical protein
VTGSRGVVVLGMHRSGTSAAAGVVNLLGVPTVTEGDLLPADAANPKGYWESDSLRAFDDELLAAVRRTWLLPPRRPLDWAREERVAPLRRLAAARFRRDFGRPQWVWKDPRACLTLPFWLDALALEPAIVLVHRHPLEVATSLAERDGLELRQSLALWERYVRSSLLVARGLPTLVTGYGELLADPVGWAAGLCGFLRRRGFEVNEPGPAALAELVDPSLRRSRGGDPDSLSARQAELVGILAELRGEHETFKSPPLGPETEWAEDALAEPVVAELLARAERAERSAREYATSRSYRATAPVRWLVGRAVGVAQSRRRAPAQ